MADIDLNKAIPEILERLDAIEAARENIEAVPGGPGGGEPLWIKVEVGYSTKLKLNFHDYATRDAIMALFIGQVQSGKGYERIEITPWPEETDDA